MSDHNRSDETVVSKPLAEAEARVKCEEAAAMLIEKHVPGGLWQWIDKYRLRVYMPNGDAFMTLSLESLQ